MRSSAFRQLLLVPVAHVVLRFGAPAAAGLAPAGGLPGHPPVLVTIPSPDGRVRAERRLGPGGWSGVLLDRTGGVLADLGFDIHPLGWVAGGDSLLAVRLIDDGHEVRVVESVVLGRDGSIRPAPRGVGEREWASLYMRPATTSPDSAPGPTAAGELRAGDRWVALPSVVAVDPGHGGPGAGQWNGNNGDGGGAAGPGGLTEQWVNLRVSELLMEWLDNDPRFSGSFRTRTASTQAVSLADRVALASQHGAALFVSVHHNGLPAGVPNRTEAYWCRQNGSCPDDAACAGPARKLHDALVAAFHYPGHGALEDSSGTGRFHFHVLRAAGRPAALVEASSISGDSAEEWRFGHDPSEQHARDEARALYIGILDWFGYSTAASPEQAERIPAPVTLGEPRHEPGGAITVEVECSQPAGDFALELTDLLGRRLRRDRLEPVGHPIIWRWDGKNGAGTRMSAGLYWLVARQDDRILASRRLTWLP